MFRTGTGVGCRDGRGRHGLSRRRVRSGAGKGAAHDEGSELSGNPESLEDRPQLPEGAEAVGRGMQMGASGPSLALHALHLLDRIAGEHADWMKHWHLRILARRPADAGEEAATGLAPMVAWREARDDPYLQGHPSFVLLFDEHRSITAEAETLARRVDAEGHVPAEAYSGFMDRVLDMTVALRRIQNDIWSLVANVDPLTGLGNRQAMWARLRIEADRHARGSQPCCVAMVDLDMFKPVNDRFGHAAGDVVLQSVASLLVAGTRPYDAVFRFGGDEFLLCLPNARPMDAWTILERLRLTVAETPVAIDRHGEMTTTISVGIAPLIGDHGVESAVERADQALYAAKRGGRDRVSVWNRS